jgi:hypothetical protein
MTEEIPTSGDVPPAPTVAGIAESLRWLRMLGPITASRVLDRYDILCMPVLSKEADLLQRAERFLTILPAAIARVADPLERAVLAHTVDPSSHETVRARIAAARLGAIERRFLATATSTKAVEGVERRALLSLSRVLLSYQFAAEILGEAVPTSTPPEIYDRGYGFVFTHRIFRLTLDPDRPRTQHWSYTVGLRITQPNTRVFTSQYRYSGSGSLPLPRVTSLSQEHSYLGTRAEEKLTGGDWYAQFFHLGRAHPVGHETVITWEEETVDTGGTFRKMMATDAGFAGVRSIRFELRPNGWPVSNVRGGQLRLDGMALQPECTGKPVPMTDAGLFTYTKPQPPKGQWFGIWWV